MLRPLGLGGVRLGGVGRGGMGGGVGEGGEEWGYCHDKIATMLTKRGLANDKMINMWHPFGHT